jgi:hypothetical protein
MGGQACILYGAAEFSRDLDVAVAVDPGNLDRSRHALGELEAEPVDVPELSADALRRGHACHFRCHAKGLAGFRVDVMSVMRGTDPFDVLWRRRMKLALSGVGTVAVLSLADLVAAKKTQRDKDWPMIRRLVEADVARAKGRARGDRVRFWLRECRTPSLLADLGRTYARFARTLRRPALRYALSGKFEQAERELRREEDRERERDRKYWAPLRAELERLRHEARR